jgi:hypothetical protein
VGAAISPAATSAPAVPAMKSEFLAFLMQVHPFENGPGELPRADGQPTTYAPFAG